MSGLVFAAIAPHGALAIPEACGPGEERLAAATQRGMERLGRMFKATKPETVVIATPHNVHISGALGVVVAGRVAGRLAGAPPSIALDVPSDSDLAWTLLASLINDEVPSAGVSFGGNDPTSAVAPMDWGVLIPLWFMGGRQEPPVPVVVVTPARDLPAKTHVKAGKAIARAAAASGRRVAFIASADHGHAHLAGGPYGYDGAAADYDRTVCELIRGHQLDRLVDITPDFVERAKADSWWQMLILLGAVTPDWHSRLLSYEAPTYYGMLTAAFTPPVSRGSASPPDRRTPHRTRAR